jgi:tetratricopeptide (TPR) repeat protein
LSLLEHHHFIPCEGGEHAISNEYLFASEALGLQCLAQGKTEEALAWFQKAQTIPENLGGGVWHPVMLTPYQYLEGICLTTLEKQEEAAACWGTIDDYPLNYFTRMYLPSFPIWKGMAEMKLGKLQKGTKLCRDAFDEAERAMYRHDYGPFAATPFFNSFQESPPISRKRQSLTLQGIALEALGENEKAMQAFSTVVNSIPSHKEAGLYLRFPLP